MARRKTAINFKSKAAYRRWLRYGHTSGVFKKVPGNTPVKIRGIAKRVSHGKPYRGRR